MKTPKQKRKIVVRWSCGYGHEHKIKELAQTCIDRNAGRQLAKKDTRERRRKIALEWAECKNFSEVGRKNGLTGSRVSGMVKMIERISRGCILFNRDSVWLSKEYAYKYFYIKMGSKLSNDMIYESIKNQYW